MAKRICMSNYSTELEESFCQTWILGQIHDDAELNISLI